MRKPLLSLSALLAATAVFFATARAEQMEKPVSPPAGAASEEAKYTRAIEGRTADILALLGINDTAKSARVHNVIMAQYRALRAWHDANDARLKALGKEAHGSEKEAAATAGAQLGQIHSSLKALHDQFLSKLSADLTPQQVEKVKDKMTYNKVEVTYNSYCEIVPNLTPEQKAKILDLLREAREEAMDAGSADEKSAVFKQYKGKINNYLSAQGHDVGKAYKDWGKKQKAGEE